MIERIGSYLPNDLRRYLSDLPLSEQTDLMELRLRRGAVPLIVTARGRRVCPLPPLGTEGICEIFRRLCGSSPYAFRAQIAQGFITVPGGHRVGLIGTAVLDANGIVTGMRDVEGFVFRFRRTRAVPVDTVLSRMENLSGGVVIAGPPCSGKTTFLASLALALSQTRSVAVIDEREELFPDVCAACDVLRGYPKQAGILQALRTLSPQVVICDELGTAAEAEAMRDGICSGVLTVFTVHAACAEELFLRPSVRRLASVGGIGLAVFLSRDPVGKIIRLLDGEALRDAMDPSSDGVSALCVRRRDVRDDFVDAPQTTASDRGSDPPSATADPL